MKKQMLIGVMVFMLALAGSVSAATMAAFDHHKPPRPEKVKEAIPERPSEFHVWREGRWKWKKKEQSWIWKEGYWSFDHDYYRWKTFNRFGRSFNSFYRPRYLAIPIGRGYYRIVRYR